MAAKTARADGGRVIDLNFLYEHALATVAKGIAPMPDALAWIELS